MGNEQQSMESAEKNTTDGTCAKRKRSPYDYDNDPIEGVSLQPNKKQKQNPSVLDDEQHGMHAQSIECTHSNFGVEPAFQPNCTLIHSVLSSTENIKQQMDVECLWQLIAEFAASAIWQCVACGKDWEIFTRDNPDPADDNTVILHDSDSLQRLYEPSAPPPGYDYVIRYNHEREMVVLCQGECTMRSLCVGCRQYALQPGELPADLDRNDVDDLNCFVACPNCGDHDIWCNQCGNYAWIENNLVPVECEMCQTGVEREKTPQSCDEDDDGN
uniref:Uncharacterized protein n=1 Tax=Elphidium margaritaceum TaxID=933848 RepID=A0A7S0TEW5_9EUKA|mmetsp:Transcript_2291/g.4452  ORF Transcript_2291/g.4452 Transcript_2291/m.4452 type:complete len:272 (+) Transcript_2291:27-842(+)